MNIDLLVTDLLPFVTPLYSYGYAQKTGAVTNGNKVKICVLLPWELWLARLSAIGNKVTNDFCVFLCIYAFFVWAHDRQSRYKQKSSERQYRTAGKIEQTPAHKTARDCWCYNPTIFHSLAEIPQNTPEKFWLMQIYGIFYGIIDLFKNKIYLNQHDMLPFWALAYFFVYRSLTP